MILFWARVGLQILWKIYDPKEEKINQFDKLYGCISLNYKDIIWSTLYKNDSRLGGNGF